MPTILRQNGFEVRIRTDDHDPPHVHVRYAGEEVVINLGIGFDDPHVRENRGMSRPNIRRAMDIVTIHNEALLEKWQRIHL